MTSSPDVIIIGAGLSGLSCARRLHDEGISFQILEGFAYLLDAVQALNRENKSVLW